MRYIKLTLSNTDSIIKGVIIRKEDILSVKDFGARRTVTVQSGKDRNDDYIVENTLDEIYKKISDL